MSSPVFGVFITVVLYLIGSYIASKLKSTILNKFVIAVILGIGILLVRETLQNPPII